MSAPKDKVLTAAQMREADRRCIEELGIPGAVLMNNAGTAVFAHVKSGPVGVVCGKGNNGGDGYVVARLALLAGLDPKVVLIADPEAITGDAKTFLDAYKRLGGEIVVANAESDAQQALAALSDCGCIVDALLGTGISGEVRGPARAAIEAWPKVRTIAVDLPSGLDAETGEPCGCAVRAEVTVTLQYAKTGLVQPAAKPYVGTLEVADIGIPAVCADDDAWNALRKSW
jgi:NAD(P)H-hydrate epimerase